MAKTRLKIDNVLFSGSDIESEPTEGTAQETTGRKRPGRKPNPAIIHNENGGQSSQEGLTAEYTRFSVIAKVSNVDDLRNYAYTKRLAIKDAMDQIIEDFFIRYRSDPTNEPLLDRNGDKDNAT